MSSYVWNGLTDDWTVPADWTPTGVPGVGDTAAITAPGTYTLGIAAGETISTDAVTLNATSATLQIDGQLSASGTIALDAGSIILNGTLANATILGHGGTIASSLGTFSNITYAGTLDLGSDGLLLVQNGLKVTDSTGTGPGVIDVTGDGGAALIFSDAETIDNVTLNVGSNVGFDSVNANGATLQLGAGVVINSVGLNGLQLGGAASITSHGTINAGVAGGTASIDSTGFVNAGALNVTNGQTLSISAGTFGNTGTIFIDSISEVDFAGSTVAATQGSGGTVDIKGTLNANGSTIDLGATSTFAHTTLGGTLENAVIVSDGGVITYNLGTLVAATVDGTLDLGDSGLLQIAGGLVVTGANGTGPGVIDVTGSGAALILTDAETLDQVTLNVGSSAGFDSVNANGATLLLGAGAVVNSVGINGLQLQGVADVTNLGHINAAVAGGIASIDTGSFENAGTIAVGNHQLMTVRSESGTITNTGLLSATGGGSLDIASSLSGTGTIAVGSRSAVEFGAAVASTQTVLMQGTLVDLVLDDPATMAARIYGFVSSDRIDLNGVATLGSSVATVGADAVVTAGGQTFSLDFVKPMAGRGFGLVSDGQGGSFLITGQVINGPAGGHATINAGTGNAIITAQGSANTITATSCDSVISAGSGGAKVTLGNGNGVVTIAGLLNTVVGGNGSDVVTGTASGSLVSLGAGNNQVQLTGKLDLVQLGGGNNTVGVTGNLDAIRVGNGTNAITVSGTTDLVQLAAGTSTVSIGGSHNAVFLGSGNATVADSGTGLNAVETKGIGAHVLTNVASDPSFVLDLVGVGGYTSAAQAYAALQSDGNGGSLLAFGTTGSVDFAGVTAAQLSAHNFAVVPAFHLA